MIKSMYSAVTGLRGHQTMLDVIGNNIANVNTAGYKSSRVLFKDLYYQTLSASSAPTATSGGSDPMQIGYGSSVSSIDVLTTRSGYQQTSRPLDLYISGEGYFAVQDSTGKVNYSRVGSLQFNSNGALIDSNSNFVLGSMPQAVADPDTGLISFDDSNTEQNIKDGILTPIVIDDFTNYTGLYVSNDGKVTGTNSITLQIETLGQLALATFSNPDALSQEGNMTYTETKSSGRPVYSIPGSSATGSLVSGGLEMSNVDLTKEFTDMIVAQRGFQANSRVITTSDQILEELVNLKR
ncbi:MAG: hypothetical protein A2Y17_04350 [Clostridiales bacterium GWF2_38_85]|nr:MAG: hypothetical protein A2Y17_04350 [Clostridiales bacterium GWF2_38_85]HBL83417.1 flagellar basal body rod protein FlgG [Clostridiales bacterium]